MKVSDPQPFLLERISAGVIATALTTYGLMVLQAQIKEGFDTLGNIFIVGSATVAILCWWVVLFYQREQSRRKMGLAFRGGVIVGGISFLAGFVGPILLTPQANQGPLVGIFITGPIGFIVGIIAGYIFSIFKTRGKSA